MAGKADEPGRLPPDRLVHDAVDGDFRFDPGDLDIQLAGPSVIAIAPGAGGEEEGGKRNHHAERSGVRESMAFTRNAGA